MKEERKALLNALIQPDKSSLIFQNLEKYKTRDADPDLNLSFKRATDDAMAMRKSFMKKFWLLFAPSFVFSMALLIVGSLFLNGEQNTFGLILIAVSAVSFAIFTFAIMKYLRKLNSRQSRDRDRLFRFGSSRHRPLCLHP